MRRLPYEFFKLNISGFIDTSECIALEDDHAARRHAVSLLHPHPVEIWRAKRKVDVVPATRRQA